jgi:hypothetical protein
MKKIYPFLLFLLLSTAISCKKSATSSQSATPPATSSKTPILGLVAQGSADSEDSTWVPDNTFPEINAHPNVYVATIIRVEWKQLEPQPGQFDFSVIDGALANITTYNLAHTSNPVTGKLRIFCGVNAPGWVKTLAGGPVESVDPTTGATYQIGCFWTTDYRQAFQALQTALAARYDSNPLIQEVAISSCSTLTAEPFVQAFNSTTIPLLHAKGYTDDAFKAALTGALTDYAAWKITPLDYTFNPYRATDSGVAVTDTTFAPTVMQAFRTQYGARAVIANHGLQSPAVAAATSIYSAIAALNKPIEFQTVSPTVDWNTTIALGLTYSPTEIEIWDTKAAGGSANVSLQQLQTWASEIGH